MPEIYGASDVSLVPQAAATGSDAIPSKVYRIMASARPLIAVTEAQSDLAALVREAMKSDPFSGTVFVFRAKRADRVKILLWDGSGMVLIAKRLEQDKFAWPTVRDGVMRLSSAQLAALFEGLDWRRVHAQRTRRPVAAAKRTG